MNDLIISLAVNGRENYIDLQKGLRQTLHLTNAGIQLHTSYPGYCTPHSESPYKFKAQLLRQAYKDGYERVFWLDSTMRLLRDPFELFERTNNGIVAFDNIGHPLWQYISDAAADNMWTLYHNIEDVYHIWGGAVGYDFTNDVAVKCLAEFVAQAEKGSFNNGGSDRPGFIAHRHEQSVLSVIFHHYGVELLPYGVIAARADVTEETYVQYGD